MRATFHLFTFIFLLLFSSVICISTPGFRNVSFCTTKNKISLFFVVQDHESIGDDEEKTSSTILVSTIDGRLRALDSETGEIKWTLQEGLIF